MKIFPRPNTSNNWKCPICETNNEKEVTLIEIDGTKDDHIAQADQVHVECLDLILYKDQRIIAMKY